MSGPFKGVRVLELTSTVSGPFAGMMLADQGAEVIKIEPPGIGDLARFMGTIKDGMGAMFSTLNRNKKCICLDFKNEEDLSILMELVSTADVLIENYRPGIVKKLGIDYETLKKIKPDLIYCSISGYGQSGAYKEKKVAKLGFSSLYEYFDDKIRKEETEKEVMKTKRLTPFSSKK